MATKIYFCLGGEPADVVGSGSFYKICSFCQIVLSGHGLEDVVWEPEIQGHNGGGIAVERSISEGVDDVTGKSHPDHIIAATLVQALAGFFVHYQFVENGEDLFAEAVDPLEVVTEVVGVAACT